MARLFEVKELEARRQALAAESEIYRQTLRLEVQYLRLYAAGWKRTVRKWTFFNPLLLMLVPLARAFFSLRHRQRSRWQRLVPLLLLGWRVAQKLLPFFRSPATREAFFRFRRRAEEQTPAANI